MRNRKRADRIDKVPLEFSQETLGKICIDKSHAAKILDFFQGAEIPSGDEWLETIQAYARQIDKDMKSQEERILDFDRACGIIGSYENRPDN